MWRDEATGTRPIGISPARYPPSPESEDHHSCREDGGPVGRKCDSPVKDRGRLRAKDQTPGQIAAADPAVADIARRQAGLTSIRTNGSSAFSRTRKSNPIQPRRPGIWSEDRWNERLDRRRGNPPRRDRSPEIISRPSVESRCSAGGRIVAVPSEWTRAATEQARPAIQGLDQQVFMRLELGILEAPPSRRGPMNLV